MKLPWKKIEEEIEEKLLTICNHFSGEIQKLNKTVMLQINTWKKSEQLKYNRVESRLQIIESTFAKEIQAAHLANEAREREAAKEIDEGLV